MENRIKELFKSKKRNLLSIFYTSGFPSLRDTLPIAQYLEKAGVDIIEIGIPFSDPIADGPTIQESNKIALDNGMNLHLLLEQVQEIRKSVNLPIILMGYLNPVLQYGFEKFVKEAAKVGVDGLILPDLPLDEYLGMYKSIVDDNGLTNTFLISPTTSEERIRKIDAATNGFIYAVSSSSTTGAQKGFSTDQESYFKRLQDMKLENPFLIGFGVSNHETFAAVSKYSSGAIVGSAFINLLKSSTDLESDITRFVKGLR
ncbi:MAG: tryptophan synthase subunit alpha [Cyclobacteriaceae bacterium]|nr:tryptophan synthase subunit alpha [Cyclobacteriaceae bacterium]